MKSSDIGRGLQSRKASFDFRLLAFAICLSALAGCGDSGRTTPANAAPDLSLTLDQAVSYQRSRFFRREHFQAAEVGQQQLAQYPEATELAAWHILNTRSAGLAAGMEDALSLYRADSSDPWGKFALAFVLMWDSSAKQRVLNMLTEAHSAEPDNPDMVWLRAEALRRTGSPDSAISFLDESTGFLETSAELMSVKASALLDLASRDGGSVREGQAFEMLAQARRLDSSNVSAYLIPGRYLLKRERPAEAYRLLKLASSLSNGEPVHKAYWQSVFLRSDYTLEEKQVEIEASVNRVLSAGHYGPLLLVVAAELYANLGMLENAELMEEKVLVHARAGSFANHVHMARISRLKQKHPNQVEEYRAALRRFLDLGHDHDSFELYQAKKWYFESVKGDMTVDDKEVFELVHSMSEEEGALELIAYSSGVLELVQRNTHLREAEELAKDGLLALSRYPVSPTAQGDGQILPHPFEGPIRNALGMVMYKSGRMEEAEKELLAADSLTEGRDSNVPVLLNLAQFYEDSGALDRALDYLVKCASLPKRQGHPCSTVLTDYYVRQNGSSKGVDSFLKEMAPRVADQRGRRISSERISNGRSLPEFSLTSLDGSLVSSKDFLGKNLVIQFWGTWCDVSKIEMIAFAEFVRLYDRSETTSIITINNDSNVERIRGWMSDNGHAFEVLVDDGYLQRVGVDRIPRTWFVNPDGYIEFDVLGASGDLVLEYSKRVDALSAGVSGSAFGNEVGN